MKSKIMIRSACAISMMLALAACNTVQGLGKDIERGGEVIQKSAK